jgi:hypothetical protein
MICGCRFILHAEKDRFIYNVHNLPWYKISKHLTFGC